MMIGVGFGLGLSSQNQFTKKAAPQPAPQPVYLAYDTFDRADGPIGTSPSGNAWNVTSSGTTSAWVVTGGQCSYTANNDGHAYMNVSNANVRQSVKITFVKNDGLIARVVDGNNHLIARISSAGLGAFRKVAGTIVNIGNYTFAPVVGRVYSLVFECTGTTIRIHLDGEKRIEVSGETAYETATSFGFRVSGSLTSKFDDYYVEAL